MYKLIYLFPYFLFIGLLLLTHLFHNILACLVRVVGGRAGGWLVGGGGGERGGGEADGRIFYFILTGCFFFSP